MNFDRETAAREWRLSILSRGGLRVSEVDELEDHLEQIELELLEQLPADEAFWVAAHRVGTPDALTREFDKVRPNFGWATRAQWALLGLLVYWLLQPLALALVFAISGLLIRVPLFAGIGEFIRMTAQLFSLILILAGVALVVRRAGRQPGGSDKWLSSLSKLEWRGLLLVAAAIIVLQLGTQFLGALVFQWAVVPAVPGLLARIQGEHWYWLARALGYAMPAGLLLLVVAMRRRVELESPTSK